MIAAMSDVLVDTIDGFAQKSHLSEIFTSVIIIPFFSNIAEQVSAVIFAYRNKMDLCVGITAGSAIQISCKLVSFPGFCTFFLDNLFNLNLNTIITKILFCSMCFTRHSLNWVVYGSIHVTILQRF